MSNICLGDGPGGAYVSYPALTALVSDSEASLIAMAVCLRRRVPDRPLPSSSPHPQQSDDLSRRITGVGNRNVLNIGGALCRLQ